MALLDFVQAASASPSPAPTADATDGSGVDWTPIVAAIVTVVGVVSVGVINYRATIGNRHASQEQHTKELDAREAQFKAEQESQRAAVEKDQAVQRTRLLTERFGRAADQLGHEEPTVRLAGVYAMCALADEWSEVEQRQQCVDVLCGYMRLPPREAPGEDEVRGSIVDAIADHLTPKRTQVSWSALNLNFKGATFPPETDFMGVTFAGFVEFDGATFTGDAWFVGATFTHITAWFHRVTFLHRAWFNDATFTRDVRFNKATFTDRSGFKGAVFTGDAEWEGVKTRLPIDLRAARIAEGAEPSFIEPDGTITNELPLIPPSNWEGEDDGYVEAST